MSRGLQMLVEEGSIPHALMLCGPSGSRNLPPFFAEIGLGKQNLPPFFAEIGLGKQNLPPVFAEMSLGKQNLPPFFAEIGVRKQNLPPVSSKNGKNYVFRGRNHQKSLKTANSVGRIIKKRRKLRIPWTESSKIAENCKFCGQNHQKTEKTGFPHPWKSKNAPKTARRRPTKRKKQQKLLFVGRRNAKSPVFYSSLVSETQNRPFSTLRSQAMEKNAVIFLVSSLKSAINPYLCIL